MLILTQMLKKTPRNMNKFNRIIYIISFILFALLCYIVVNKFVITPNKAVKTNVEIYSKEFDIIFGNPDANQSIFVYTSYKCGFCRRFFHEVYPLLKEHYLDNNKINLVIKLIEPNQDPEMVDALQLAISVHKFGRFDKLHELLLHDYRIVYTDDFKILCDDFTKNNSEIEKHFYDNENHKYLKENYQEFIDLNLTGTPSFVINKHIYKGFKNFEELEEIIPILH